MRTTTARAAPAPPTGWASDRCPPAPFVLGGELCLPPGAAADGAQQVIGDVHVVALEVTAAHRATALALLLPRSHGVLVRATAAWVWTGEASLRPSRVDLAVPPSAPGVPGQRPGPDRRALPVRRTRWSEGAGWTRVGGVALTDPTTTAAECARLLPGALAGRCVEALVGVGGVHPEEVVGLLQRRGRAGGPAPRGTADALALLRSFA